MRKKKKIFLFIQLPISTFLLILFFELCSFLLSDYRAIRHGLDKKVAKIEQNKEKIQKEIILFGDSVTKDIADTFDLSKDKNNILNMTTNKASGLVGSYLLYQRFEKANSPPKAIIISSTPSFFTFFPLGKTKELYLTSVFNDTREGKIINKYYTNKTKDNKLSFFNDFSLSVSNLELKIIYPLIHALGLNNINNALSLGYKSVEPFNEITHVINKEKESRKNNFKKDSFISINNNFEILVEDFFEKIKKNKSQLHIAWAPIRESKYKYLKKSGELKKLEKFLTEKASEINLNLSFYDFSKIKVFPDYAFRDDDHLKIGYWQKYHAYLLVKLISKIRI